MTSTLLVDKWLIDMTSRSAGRTRYEGQEPRIDEALMAEIVRLRAQEELLVDALGLLTVGGYGDFGSLEWHARRMYFLARMEEKS